MNGEWITSGEVAKLLNVSDRSVRRWGQSGKLRTTFTVGGQRRYNRDQINELLAQREHTDTNRG